MSFHNYVNSRDDQAVAAALKKLRTKVFQLKTRKLLKLDRTDRFYLLERLQKLDAELEYLLHWQGAQCSVVLEACGILPPE